MLNVIWKTILHIFASTYFEAALKKALEIVPTVERQDIEEKAAGKSMTSEEKRLAAFEEIDKALLADGFTETNVSYIYIAIEFALNHLNHFKHGGV